MENNKFKTICLVGNNILEYLDEIARLRITVFREYPYLYDGDTEYEEKYLKTYASSVDSVIIVALYNNKIIGVSTGLPMKDAAESVKDAFIARGYNINQWFYHGESVLLSNFRGFGIGVRFFEERECHAISLGCHYATFCGVVRPDNDPKKPVGYTPLNEFWKRRGYQMLDFQCNFSWKEIGYQEEKEFPMQFWYKGLER